jgi:hypothetical protein
MPVVDSLMASLVRQHGEDEGKRIYYAMEAAAQGPFAPGAKHYALHEAWARKNGVAPHTKRPRPVKRRTGAVGRPRRRAS